MFFQPEGGGTVPRLPREWLWPPGCQSSRSAWPVLSGMPRVGLSVQGQELDMMISVGPFQLSVFHGSVIPA